MKLSLTEDKVTPGTIRYKEDSDDHPITIYLTKERAKELDNPESISVVIEKES